MKIRKYLPLIFLVLVCITVKHGFASTSNNLTIVYNDTGVVRFDITGVGYSKFDLGHMFWQRNTAAPLNNIIDRGWVSFNISDINATNLYITQTNFLYDGIAYVKPTDVLIINYTGTMDSLTAQEQYEYCGNGTEIVNASVTLPTVGDNQTFVLSNDILSDLSQHISWLRENGYDLLHLAFKMDDETVNTLGINDIDEVGAVPAPTLYITYANTEFIYVFSTTYYENGTLSLPAVNVTATGPGFVTSFNTSGGTGQAFLVEPTLFFWSIGASTSRRIYRIGIENFTVTMPESTFDTFVFTVRDFTGKTSKGTAYLEAWRIINATDTLIERQIISVHNEVPLNLVIGATYTLRVRFFDGSIQDWGQFVPGDTATFTIVLRGVEITEQAYLIGNFIYVEITRPITTQLTIDYLTTRNTTIWSNVTIAIRGGAVVNTRSSTNESYTYNYAGIDANTSYTVLVNGEHTLQTTWSATKTFDGVETYPDVPDVELIFPMGGLDASNLIAWSFTLVAGLTFSVVYRKASLLSMCAVGSFFSAFGFADWSFNLLAVSWFFAFIVYLGSGD